MSCADCRLSQNSGLVLNQCARRSAVSPVIERLPWMICVIRLGGTLELARQFGRGNADLRELVGKDFAGMDGRPSHALSFQW